MTTARTVERYTTRGNPICAHCGTGNTVAHSIGDLSIYYRCTAKGCHATTILRRDGPTVSLTDCSAARRYEECKHH